MKSKIELNTFYWAYVLDAIEQRKNKALKKHKKSPYDKYKKSEADLYTDIFNEIYRQLKEG